jgi:hypothetical protein
MRPSDALARQQAHLRTLRAECETFTACMDATDPEAVENLLKLKLAVSDAEVADAEHALEGARKLQRMVALEM